MRALAITLVLLVAACSGGGDKKNDCSGPPPPQNGFAGGATPVPTAEIVLRATDGGIVVATNGTPAAVTFAPQGGFILLAGIRATGFDECVDITAAIRDPQNANAIVSLEQRPSQLEDGGDGWFYPDQPGQLYNWANLFVCGGGVDFIGRAHGIEITADDGVSTSTASRQIVPYCEFEDSYCIESCTATTSGAFTR